MAKKTTKKGTKKVAQVEEIILEAPATAPEDHPVEPVETTVETKAKETKSYIHRYDPASGMAPVALCGTKDGTLADRNEVVTCPKCRAIIKTNEEAQKAFHLYRTPWGLIATRQQIDGARVLVATNLLHHAHGLSGRGPMRFDTLPSWIQTTVQVLVDMGVLELSDGYLVSGKALYFANDGQADALGFDPLSAIRIDARPTSEARGGLASEVAPPTPPPPVVPAYLTPEERQTASKYLVTESGETDVEFDLPSPPMIEVLGAVKLAPPNMGPSQDTTFSFHAEPDSETEAASASEDTAVAVVREKEPEIVPEPLPAKPWDFDEE